MTPTKYRRRSRTIEAIQLTLENQSDVMEWTGGRPWSRPPMRAITGILVPTPTGTKRAQYGDWVIKTSTGENDVLTQEQFAEYERADRAPTPDEAAHYKELWQQADREMRDWKHRCAERAATEVQLRERITQLEQQLQPDKQTT